MATRNVPVSCNRDCGAGCPLIAQVSNGKVIKITDNPLKAPHMRGCIRGFQMPATLYSEQRLKTPLLRTAERGSGQFREISWNEALDRIAAKLGETREKYGCPSVLAFDGSGSCRGAVHHTGLLTKRFFACYGGFTGRTDSYSSAAAAFAEAYLFGTRQVGFDPPTLIHSNLIILWGANVCDTRLSCRIESILGDLKRRGTPIIVIDPRRSATVRHLATRWIPIHPGTDTALMAAVLYVLIEEGYADTGFAEIFAVGFADLAAYVKGRTDGAPKTPAWAAGICGVPADQIEAFARTYGRSKPAALLPGLSIQRTLGGEETYRFAAALQVATGNTGQAGGTSGGEFWGRLPVPRFPRMPVPDTSSLPAIPVYRWADVVLTGRAGGYPTDIRIIYNTGTNYLNQGSDIKKNRRAFAKADFVVTHDLFLTPTARYSDVVLPVTTFLEREDVALPADNFLFYSHKAVEPIAESRNDYDIYRDLAERLGFGRAFSENRTAEAWLEKFLQESAVEDIAGFKSTGIFKGEDQARVGLSAFVQNPQAYPLDTPSGKIEIRSEAYAATGFSAIPECRITLPEAPYPLRLISPHARSRINSTNANLTWTASIERQVLEMHRRDGEARGITSGDQVRVSSPQGAMEIEVDLTEDIIPGTVSLLQGAWTDIDAAGTERGGAANILTSTEPTLPSQGARTHSVFVEVARVAPGS